VEILQLMRKDSLVKEQTTSHLLRVGVQFHPQHTSYASFAGAVRRVEDLGVDTIWDWDHFFPLYGDPLGNHSLIKCRFWTTGAPKLAVIVVKLNVQPARKDLQPMLNETLMLKQELPISSLRSANHGILRL